MHSRWTRPEGKLTNRVPRLVLALCVPLCLADSVSAPHPTPVVNSSVVPDDVSIPAGFGGNPIAFFDDYSWRAFIAVVWPGLQDQQGVPDTMLTVDGAGPRVFETYKSLEEVFHNDGSAPAPLDKYDAPIY